ncbi:MAG: homoserine kinase [Flavobacterium sp.]|uniref:phosphotransferase n=1 Tax=Flavobacterium sp. TaxID=239 RepID=UPI001224CBD3|nr:phosphotransferase [Flavobacterium sp.]RZJ65868.1 MAG: homoserine kinase [Flavobacterium sp.]
MKNQFPTISATTSTLSETELEAFAIGKYNLDKNTKCKLFRTGINHTYMLSNDSVKYVLRVYFLDWKSELEISEELDLLRMLDAHGIGVSIPVSDTFGNFIQAINAPEGLRFAVLFTFGEGEKIRFLDDATCTTIGSTMAKMHNVTIGEKVKRIDFDENALLLSAYEKIKTIFPGELPEMNYVKEKVMEISDVLVSDKFSNLPNGIVHLDIWYDNMNVKSQNDITIFDFDNCGNGALMLDVAYFCKQLFHIETDKEVYERKVKSFLVGYEKHRRLSQQELSKIPESGAAIFIYYLGMQASRFDWSNIFLSENYLKMYTGRIKSWLEYEHSKSLI